MELAVVYYTKKRQDEANFLSTGEENKGFFKKEKMKMSPFYAERKPKLVRRVLITLRPSPTNLQSEILLRVNDYRKK